MAGWDEASVDELLADPMVRDLMAADRVDPGELRALLYGMQQTIERYATTCGQPTSLASFVELYSTILSADAALAALPAIRGRLDVRKSPMALADHSRLSTVPLGARFGQARCAAES
jgi:hypothetical protein